MALPTPTSFKIKSPSGLRVPSLNAGSPFRADYADRLIDLFGLNSIVSFLPLNEAPGTTVAYDYTRKGRNGAYSNVTLGQQGINAETTAASFDGTISYCNWFSTALANAFNPSEGTLMAWAKVSGAGVWTDGTIRQILYIGVDASNAVFIQRTGGNNIISGIYFAGGISKGVSKTSISNLNWMCFSFKWSASNDLIALYYDGIQVAPNNTLGVWSGTPASNRTEIGGVFGATNVWSGLIDYPILLNRAASAAEIAQAYQMAF